MTDKLPHTERIRILLNVGVPLSVAAKVHNEIVKETFEAAKKGAIINLTDLMAATEELHLAKNK